MLLPKLAKAFCRNEASLHRLGCAQMFRNARANQAQPAHQGVGAVPFHRAPVPAGRQFGEGAHAAAEDPPGPLRRCCAAAEFLAWLVGVEFSFLLKDCCEIHARDGLSSGGRCGRHRCCV